MGSTTVGRSGCNFKWRLRLELIEKITSEQSFEVGESISHINIRQESQPI